MRVLDIACGTGQPAISVAETVGPRGSVLATDFVEPVVSFARDKARERGLRNIEFRCVDGEALDVDAGSFDAATMRWGLMFMPSPVETVKHAHRALRPQGRIALSTWASPQQNPFATIALDALRQHMEVPTPPPGAPGIFAFADPDALRSTIEAGGFAEVQVEPLEFVNGVYDSGEHYWSTLRDLAAPIVRLYNQLAPDQQQAVDRAIISEADRRKEGGKIAVRGTAWIASGRT
jgi:2-polyprenyl-3-methyl-5-hydroxy-6-metoxy-1,4-benzoquinol methylase